MPEALQPIAGKLVLRGEAAKSLKDLAPGQKFPMQVLRDLGGGRYLMRIKGMGFTAETDLVLRASQRIDVEVREVAERIVLALIDTRPIETSGAEAEGRVEDLFGRLAIPRTPQTEQAVRAMLSERMLLSPEAVARLLAAARGFAEDGAGDLMRTLARLMALDIPADPRIVRGMGAILFAREPLSALVDDAINLMRSAAEAEPPLSRALEAVASSLQKLRVSLGTEAAGDELGAFLRTFGGATLEDAIEAIGRMVASRLAASPQLARLDQIIAALIAASGAERFPQAPGRPPEMTPELAEMIRLLESAGAGGNPAEPMGSLARNLAPDAASALLAHFLYKERDIFWRDPVLSRLGEAHELLSEASARTSAYKAQSFPSPSGSGEARIYAEVPLAFEGKTGTVRLRLRYRRDGSRRAPAGPVKVLMDLDVESLGRVRVEASVHGGNIVGRFESPESRTVEFLSENLSALTEELRRKGFEASFTSSLSRAEEGGDQFSGRDIGPESLREIDFKA